MSVREASKQLRRERIVDAVVSAVVEEGLDGVTVGKVSSRAGLSVPTLYNLIGPVDDLVGAMVDKMFREFDAILGAGDREAPLPRAAYAFVEATAEHLGRDPVRYRAIMRAIFQHNLAAGPSQTVLDTTRRNRLSMARHLTRAVGDDQLRSGVDADLLAEQLLGAQMLCLQAWSLSIFSLERYRSMALLQFATQLRAWARGDLVTRLDRDLARLQAELAAIGRESPSDGLPSRSRVG